MIKAVIGLGNPGHRFEKTRHNIGFRIVDMLAQQHHASWRCKDTLCSAEIMLNDQSIILIKPQTYMNNSGLIAPWLSKQGIAPDETVAIHDELEFPFGKIGIRQGGSVRGHNGLKSLMQNFGADFYRVRFGIGRPDDRADVPDYVLSNFSREEEAELPVIMGKVESALSDLISQ